MKRSFKGHGVAPRGLAGGVMSVVLATAGWCGCGSGGPPEATATWEEAFDASGFGALSSVWGPTADDVYVVGGSADRGEMHHFDGDSWSPVAIPEVPLMVWVFGFAADDIIAVGLDGAALRFDGSDWTPFDSGVDADLWGVWGPAPDDVWIVGGDVGGPAPILLHYDGDVVEPVTVPDNDRGATSLFKVWGTGSRVFAVGERGLILRLEPSGWVQDFGGPNADDDLIALWGTSEDDIVAVGGRAGARIAVYDGSGWTTLRPSGVPGLNAVYTVRPDEVLVGGVNGYVGVFRPSTGELTAEPPSTRMALHAAWAADPGQFFVVGGQFREPFSGVALVRTSTP